MWQEIGIRLSALLYCSIRGKYIGFFYCSPPHFWHFLVPRGTKARRGGTKLLGGGTKRGGTRIFKGGNYFGF